MSVNESVFDSIPGGAALLEWFGGRVPSFHDSEVLRLTLERERASATLAVHAFQMTSEIDSRGYFVCTRHVVVTFRLFWVESLELDGFNFQNALLGLSVTRDKSRGFIVEMEPAYGIGGTIHALEMEIALEPGIPADSHYLRIEPSSDGKG